MKVVINMDTCKLTSNRKCVVLVHGITIVLDLPIILNLAVRMKTWMGSRKASKRCP